MKKVKRWRYYCDFCKKAGGQPHAMREHEKHCTMNPERDCRMCDSFGGGGASLPELIAFVKEKAETVHWSGEDQDFKLLDNDDLAKLRDMAEGCPACMLAALRLTRTHAELDFKKESKAIWDMVNEQHAMAGGW